MTKDVAINFRAEESVNDYLMNEAAKFSTSKSSVVNKIIKEYPALVEKAKSVDSSSYLLNQSNSLVSGLRTKMAVFENSRLRELSDLLIGKEYKGRTMKSEADVLGLITENFTYTLINDSDRVEIGKSHVEMRQPAQKSLWAYFIGISIVVFGAVFFFFTKKKDKKSAMAT